MAVWKVAPALAAGCTVVLKPSEHASLTCQALCDVASSAGLPAGCLNVVTGLGPDAGAPLAAHPGVAKVTFTGSRATGARVMVAAAANVTPVGLELGGKSPVVVFDDCAAPGDAAALDRVCEWLMLGCFFNCGQVCSATSRLIVQKGVAPRLLARLAAHAAAIKAGDPTLADTRLGPLVNAQQHGKVTAMIAAALAGGATALTGGGRPAAATPGGYFVEPTVLVGVSADAPIWKEEVFGPVLCVAEFGSEEEAVALANATDYGLGAAVLSLDPARCARMATAFEAGIVWVNCSQPTFAQLPWGGVKRSGFGRDLGPDALQNYLSPKQILTYVPTGTAFGYYAMDG